MFDRTQNLTERARHGIDLSLPPQPGDQRRIRWWIDTYFGKSKSRFSRCLLALGVDPEKFIYLLQLGHEEGRTSGSRIKKRTRRRTSVSRKIPPYEKGGIGKLCANYLEDAHYRFSCCIERSLTNGLAVDRQAVLADFGQYLYNKVADLMVPSLILEANIQRLSLAGAYSPEKRYKLFVSSLSLDKNKKIFWDKYPVLQSRILTVVDNTTQMCIETITRVADDNKHIEGVFSISRNSTLKSIVWGNGDSHCRGRVVAILHYSRAKLVYKPRPVNADKAYNQFIDWYGQNCDFPSPRTYRNLSFDTYGYAEFIKSSQASSKSDISSYYYKQGQLIAIAWLLGITDLHHENLIASGGDPYLIDLETMFDRPHRRPPSAKLLGFLYGKATDAFLFRTGLLPNRRRGEYGVYDTSAIGASGTQPAPFAAPTVRNLGRDDVKIVSRKGTMPKQPNKPVLDGYRFDAHQYTKEIIHGFVDALDVLYKNKAVLLGTDSPLKAFKGAKLRWVPRDTMSYEQALQRMKHPTVLRDAIECDVLLGGYLWSQADNMPHLAQLISSEVSDLWDNDIPYFWTTFDTRNLYDSRGKEISNFFGELCIQGFIRRLEMIETSKKRLAEVIGLAMKSTIPIDLRKNSPFASRRFSSKKARISNDAIIAASVNIGKNFLDKRYNVENKPFWAGLTAIDDTSYTASVLQPTVYEGAPGIGIFLAELYRHTRIDIFKKAALEVHDFVCFLMKLPMQDTACGAFSGIGGLFYADILMSRALDRPIDKNHRAIGRLKKLIEHDKSFDVMSGSAGALLIALRWYLITKEQGALDVAASAARKLKEFAEFRK